jgi:hypothetical protein
VVSAVVARYSLIAGKVIARRRVAFACILHSGDRAGFDYEYGQAALNQVLDGFGLLVAVRTAEQNREFDGAYHDAASAGSAVLRYRRGSISGATGGVAVVTMI